MLIYVVLLPLHFGHLPREEYASGSLLNTSPAWALESGWPNGSFVFLT